MAEETPAQSRMKAAADQFGAAIRDAIVEGMAKGLANTLVAQGGTGPWVLRADGSISEIDGEAP